jgi:hypothetical protein
MLLPASGCLAAILLLLLARLAHSPPLSEALSVCLLALGTYPARSLIRRGLFG